MGYQLFNNMNYNSQNKNYKAPNWWNITFIAVSVPMIIASLSCVVFPTPIPCVSILLAYIAFATVMLIWLAVDYNKKMNNNQRLSNEANTQNDDKKFPHIKVNYKIIDVKTKDIKTKIKINMDDEPLIIKWPIEHHNISSIKRYDSDVMNAVNALNEYYHKFEKYIDNQEIKNILKNFLTENKDIADMGSFNPFILDSKYFSDFEYFDDLNDTNYCYDSVLLIKNTLQQYKIQHSNFDELFNTEYRKKTICETELPIEITYTFNTNQEKFITLLDNAYSSMDELNSNEHTYIVSNMRSQLKTLYNNENIDFELYFNIFHLATHYYINNSSWDNNDEFVIIDSKYDKLLLKCLNDIQNRIKTSYKPVSFLIKGLKSKYQDLNEFLIYLLLQNELNIYRLEKIKDTIPDFENVLVDEKLLIKRNKNNDEFLKQLYNKKFSVEEIINILQLLNVKYLGENLLNLVEVDENYNLINNKKYSYVAEKFNEFKSEDYINHLSTDNFEASKSITITDIDLMTGFEFEEFVAKLFQKMG